MRRVGSSFAAITRYTGVNQRMILGGEVNKIGMMVFLIFTCFLFLVLVLFFIDSLDRKNKAEQLKKFRAIDSYTAYHVGGAPKIPVRAGITLLVGEDHLTIKRRKQVYVIPLNEIIAAEKIIRSDHLLDDWKNRGRIDSGSPESLRLGPMLELMDPQAGPRIFKERNMVFLLLNYHDNMETKAMAFGFPEKQDFEVFDAFYSLLLSRIESCKNPSRIDIAFSYLHPGT
ncbi:hypothetical protein [Paenibacillus turpanensis]|uniref:hypothetical protein n=1 Tax=Paenibacillus turpanensis TaxID=2689078 RepID=UPI00140DD96C|nr:hypothetical protein [Paenibacillus turpanensis]